MKVKNKTFAGICAVIALVAIYFLLPPVRQFISDSIAVLSSFDPKHIENGVTALRSYLLTFGAWAPLVSGSLMILQMIIAPIPGQLITFTNGLVFGALWGTVLSWSSAMAGAAVCFAIANVFGRPVVERLVGVKSLQYVDGFFEKYGAKAIIIARLIPFVPFDPVSYGAGLTKTGFWRFFIATGIGQLPATILYSWLGQKATGSVQAVFMVFVSVLALAILLMTLKPWFDKRVVGKGNAKESSVKESSSLAC
jgi:uncharacterized membrane protein YdjX (TVP38/TMEM64 family)